MDGNLRSTHIVLVLRSRPRARRPTRSRTRTRPRTRTTWAGHRGSHWQWIVIG